MTDAELAPPQDAASSSEMPGLSPAPMESAPVDPLDKLMQTATEQAVPKATAPPKPNPAAQRVAAKTAATKATEAAVAESADTLATMRAELQAEMDRKFAVNNAIRDEAIRLQMEPDHVALFAGCQTPEEVSATAGLLHNYLSKTVEAVRAGMLQQMRDEGYKLVKADGQVSTPNPNGAAPQAAFDPFAPLPPLQFQSPLARASKPGTAPAKPSTFAEAAAMVAKGVNIA